LRAHLSAKLPEYMVPAAYVMLGSLPLTPNGKLDRKALPAPEHSSSAGYRKPRTREEEILCTLFAEVLGLERVGIEDSFFELGGHSLLVMRIISRIKSVFQIDMSPRHFFSNPTVGALADAIRSQPSSSRYIPNSLLSIGKTSRKDLLLSLSCNQARHLLQEEWADLHSAPQKPLHMLFSLNFNGSFSQLAMEQALDDLIRRHDTLQTGFFRTEHSEREEWIKRLRHFVDTGLLVQSLFEPVIVPIAPLTLDVIDLTDMEPLQSRSEAGRIIDEAASKRFAYNAPPLMRTLLFRFSNTRHRLVFVIHHLIADRHSIAILRRELRALYIAHVECRLCHLPALSIRYADFAHWQRHVLSRTSASSVRYWQKQWADYGRAQLSIKDLPFAQPASTKMSAQCNYESITTDTETTTDIYTFIGAVNVSLTVFFLAAFGILLHDLTSKSRIAIWVNFANRAQPGTEHVVGWFVNSHIIGIDFAQRPSTLQLLQQVRDTMITSLEFQELPLALLWETTGGQRFRSDTIISLDVVVVGAVGISGLVPANYPRLPRRARGLEIMVLASPQQITITAQYATRNFNGRSIRDFLTNLKHIIGRIIYEL